MAKEAGIEDPTDDQLRQFDRARKGKKTSNDDWRSPSYPNARIAKMMDGTTGHGYSAENAVDLETETEIVVAADVKPADAADGGWRDGQGHRGRCAGPPERRDEAGVPHRQVVADKGYHKTEILAWLGERDIRTYVAPRRDTRKRCWDKLIGVGKPREWASMRSLLATCTALGSTIRRS